MTWWSFAKRNKATACESETVSEASATETTNGSDKYTSKKITDPPLIGYLKPFFYYKKYILYAMYFWRKIFVGGYESDIRGSKGRWGGHTLYGITINPIQIN